MTAGSAAHPRVHSARRHLLVLVLAVNSGATDALGLLGLGGAFTSVMTGNMVIIGAGAATADAELSLLAASAVVSFSLGCAVGVRLAGTARPGDPAWPRPICWALLAELVIMGAFAGGWWLTGSSPGAHAQLGFLCMNAVALGVQSSAVQRLGQSGLSTTYLTGTLTTLVMRVATGYRLTAVSDSLQILGALVLGALVGGLLTTHIALVAPVVQLACLGLVVLVGALGFRAREEASSAVTAADAQR